MALIATIDTERQRLGEAVGITNFQPVGVVSVAAWVKCRTLPSTWGWLVSSCIVNGQDGITIGTTPGNKIYGAICNGYRESDSTFSAGQWVFIVVSGGVRGTTPKLWVNGLQQTAGASGASTNSSFGGTLLIGGKNTNPFPGPVFGCVRLYDSEITDSEVAALYAAGPGIASSACSLKRYLLPCFTEQSEQLHLLTSDDGKTFSRYPIIISGSFPSARDPRYFYDFKTDKHFIGFTNGAFAVPHSQFVVVKSDTPAPGEPFVFSTAAVVDCSSIGGGATQQTWGPKAYFDPVSSIPYWYFSGSLTGNSGPFSCYVTYPTNAAWTTWATPALVTGSAMPANTIDGAPFYYEAGTYYYIGKDEATGYPFIACGTSPIRYDTLLRSGDCLGVGKCEGFSALRVGQKWRIYFDDYTNTGFLCYVESSSLDLATCTFGPAVRIIAPVQSRNGGIVKR